MIHNDVVEIVEGSTRDDVFETLFKIFEMKLLIGEKWCEILLCAGVLFSCEVSCEAKSIFSPCCLSDEVGEVGATSGSFEDAFDILDEVE